MAIESFGPMIFDYDSVPEEGDQSVAVTFARFLYIGVTQLGRTEEVLLMPVGELLDQW